MQSCLAKYLKCAMIPSFLPQEVQYPVISQKPCFMVSLCASVGSDLPVHQYVAPNQKTCTCSEPFTRRPIHRMSLSHLLDNSSGKLAQPMYSTKKSNKWDRGPFAQQVIRVWACQPNYPRHSTELYNRATCFPSPFVTKHDAKKIKYS